MAATGEAYSVRPEERGLRIKDELKVRSPALLLRIPPLGPSNGKDTNLPYAVVVKVSPKTREPKFSAFPGERVHLPPAQPGRSDTSTTYEPQRSSSPPFDNP